LTGLLAGAHLAAQTRWIDFAMLIVGTALWVAMARWILEKTGSALPRVAMRRLGLG
jgi:hypothetical protein